MSSRPAQLTVADYKRLDLVDPTEIIPAYRVVTRHPQCGVYEYLGIDPDGWLVRTEIDTARYTHKDQVGVWVGWRHLPYLRVVDEQTGRSFSDPEPRGAG